MSGLELSLGRVFATSKRDFPALAKESMRGVVKHLIGITPPASITRTGDAAWNVVQGRDALQKGRALVRSDIRSVYGSPGDAYDEIAKRDKEKADLFWRHHKRHKTDEANKVMQEAIGRKMYVFDGGKAHQNLKRGRARGKAKSFIFFTMEMKPLDEYIRLIQDRVGWLAGGWNQAAAELGIKPPQWIWKHEAPGLARIEESESHVRIVATNAVSFASSTDLDRRVQYAADQQAAALDRRLESFMAEKFKMAGFTILN